jgi:hypothetical protein
MSFESADLRILRKYASNSLNIDKADIRPLIIAMQDIGLKITATTRI